MYDGDGRAAEQGPGGGREPVCDAGPAWTGQSSLKKMPRHDAERYVRYRSRYQANVGMILMRNNVHPVPHQPCTDPKQLYFSTFPRLVP